MPAGNKKSEYAVSAVPQPPGDGGDFFLPPEPVFFLKRPAVPARKALTHQAGLVKNN
jgi:hypothetical protein